MRRQPAELVALSLLLALCSPGCAPSQDEQVREFVRATYAHGVPYDKARALGASAEQILVRLFGNPDMKPHRSNIVVTLGILGSKDAALEVIKIIETGSGPLTADEVSLRMDAVMALGYAAYAASSRDALKYLIDGLDAGAWSSRIKWTLPSGASPAERLRARAIGGLGLSAQPDALLELQNLLGLIGGGGGGGRGGGDGGGTSAAEQALITEAIGANQFIAAHGMSKYYEAFLR